MARKKSAFNAALEPIATPLPTTLAAFIGRAIARHSYMEWMLGQVLYSLLEISIKQGRKVIRRPEPRQYVAAVQGLYAFHKLEGGFRFDDLARRLESADRARDLLAHSVYMHDGSARAAPVHMVRGSWSLPLDAEVVSRDEWPEAPAIDRNVLSQLRDDIEQAVTRAERLLKLTDRLLRELHEKRRTQPGLNRRRGER